MLGWVAEAFSVSGIPSGEALGKPKQKYKWDMRPTVRVCSDSGVSINRAARAVKYWEHLGYDFDGVYGGSFSTCMNPKFGEIVIMVVLQAFLSVLIE